jgi:uncharacterized protein (DUF1778 family)
MSCPGYSAFRRGWGGVGFARRAQAYRRSTVVDTVLKGTHRVPEPVAGGVDTVVNVRTMYRRYVGDEMTTEQRDSRWNFRVKSRSDALVREAATLMGTSKTAFVEESAVSRARSLIAEYQPVALSSEEFSRFVDSLDEVPVAIPDLVDLFSRPSQIPRA